MASCWQKKKKKKKKKKKRSRRYPAQRDEDYADDIALLANTPAQAKSLLHSLEWAACGIGLHVNTNITEYRCFNQRGDISILKGGPLKQVDKFIHIGNSISSTENDINMWLAKAWTAIDRLLVIWKSDLFDKIKQFFPSSSCINTAIWMHYSDAKHMEKNLMVITQECCKLYRTTPGGNTQQNSSCMATYHPSGKPSKLDEQDMQDTAGKYERTHKQCTPVNPLILTSKGWMTSKNLSTAALCRYRT